MTFAFGGPVEAGNFHGRCTIDDSIRLAAERFRYIGSISCQRR
jgi:hypothetical protein